MTTTKVKDDVICLTLTANNVKKAVKTYTMSKKYINTMLKASVINILYHRLNIGDKEFITKKFNDVSYKSFRPKSKNLFIRDFHTYMLACRDALDKNYLRDFYLYFMDATSGDIIENYKFSFQYTAKNVSPQTQNENVLIENTAELLRALEDLGTHKKFEGEIDVKAEITYFDDAPEDYEPPGFERIEESKALMKKIDKSGNSVILGKLFTGFHTLKCRGKGDIFNFNTSLTSANPSPEIVEDDVSVIDVESKNNEEKIENNEILTEDYSVPGVEIINESINADYLKMNDSDVMHFIDISADDDTQVNNCLCKMVDTDSWSVDQVECKTCKRVYHSPCQGYLDNSFVLEPFSCIFCRTDADSLVNAFDTSQSKLIYRIRYIIGTIYKFGRAPEEIKSTFPETLVKLRTLNIFEIEGNRIKNVNEKVLHSLFKFNYKKPDLKKFKTL